MNSSTNCYQKSLSDISCDCQRMSILQPQTGVKLQSISANNRQYIKSTSDAYQDVRVLTFALIIKIYSDNTFLHRQCQQKFKTIIYNSDLEDITLHKGLLKQQLHKIVYQNLCQLAQTQDKIETMLSIFNNSPFFDQIVMSSMKSYFQVKRPQKFNFWQQSLSQYFDIAVTKKDNNAKSQNKMELNAAIQIVQQNNTLLWQYVSDQNPITLTKSKQESQGSFVDSSFGKFRTEQKLQLPISCQSISSPTFGKQNINIQNIFSSSRQGSLLKNLQFSPMTSRKSQKITKRPVSSFWAIFCCGGD